MAIPDGAEAVRPFLPTRDFEVSRAFYEALGFEKVLDGDVAIFAIGTGGAGIILQRHFTEGWAEQCMVQLMVDDLDAWWAHVQTLELDMRFGVRPPSPPAVQPWGLRIVYLFDPAGVLWHVAERRPNAGQD
jgi:catechol 2,3-dioxygenase-like lactoylglutathione lyase family enzyme